MDYMDLRRYSEINGVEEVTDLKYGMDFRNPIYRREVFLRFFEFHLKYYSHPGAVYYVMPYLAKKYSWTMEQKLWYAFINGATQNPLSSWAVFSVFPDFSKITEEAFEKWHWDNWRRLQYDTDRRYAKGKLSEMFVNYKKVLNGKTQEEFFKDLTISDDPKKNFDKVWDKVYNDFFLYGRLSTFSYTEYLKIMGVNIDCSNLFIFDKSGSKSHRNGICRVLGRDDLDWHKGLNELGHTKEHMAWIEKEADLLMDEAKARFKGREFEKDVNYFTLESTLCTYKSHYRPNRRYPGVYNDMFHGRIKYAEAKGWEDHGINFYDFWEARAEALPEYLRLEASPNDPGLCKKKQNHFRLTGQMVMLDKEWDCFKNDFNGRLDLPLEQNFFIGG